MFFLYLLFNSVYILLDSIFEPKAVSLAENFYTAFYFVLYLVFWIYKGFNELYQQNNLYINSWCNGNTTSFGGVIRGSSPCELANKIYRNTSFTYSSLFN